MADIRSALRDSYASGDVNAAAAAQAAYCRAEDGVSFAELANIIGEPFRGHWSLELRPNIVVWQMSEFACKVEHIAEAKGTVDEILTWPCTAYINGLPLIYMVDGRFLRLPLAKGLRAYRKPHWLPAVLRWVGHLSDKERRKVAQWRRETGQPWLGKAA